MLELFNFNVVLIKLNLELNVKEIFYLLFVIFDIYFEYFLLIMVCLSLDEGVVDLSLNANIHS